MGLKQVGVCVFGLLLVCLCDAQWRGRSAQTLNPNMFRLQSLVQVPQQSDSRMPMLAPQKLSSQSSVLTSGRPVQDPLGVQSKQLLHGPMEKLMWTFPTLPEEPEQPEILFDLHHPISPNSVTAQCSEDSVYVEVMEDFFGTGQLLMASGFSLGGCTATGENPIVFESVLHGCGSILTVTEDELVYTFSLVYTAQEANRISTPIVRSSGAVVAIECHYPRKHDVSSNALMPTWVPYAATKIAEELLLFSLKLMTDDWRFERPSRDYFLGDKINFEASVRSYNHGPFLLFVDDCVATAVPDIAAVPRYSFIENYGCMVDAAITGSSSHFLPRTQGDKLQFQLETFRFQGENSGLVYVSCVLKAAAAFPPTSVTQKACSFSANGWISADDSDQVCGCCDSNCGMMIGSDQALRDLRWERTLAGPINVKEHGFSPM